MSSQRRNKKKSNKQPLKPCLSGTERKLLEIKTRQVEKEIAEPTAAKIFEKIKDLTRWKQHRPDVLQREIKKSMLTEEQPKKKRNRKKKTQKNDISEKDHINDENRQFEPFLFGDAANEKQKETNGYHKNDESENKNDRKRKFSQMNKTSSNDQKDNEPETVWVDTTGARRNLLNYPNNPTARNHLEEIIKDKMAQKHGKKRRKMNNESSSDPIEAAGNTSWEVIFPEITLSEVGGLNLIKDKLNDLLISLQCDIWPHLGVPPPRSVLLHGPPGSGKTLLAHAIAGHCQVAMIKASAPELVAGLSGQSEAKIRSLFESALANEPCVVFIDEIDVIANKRENAQRAMESRIVAQLLTCLDNISQQAMDSKVLFIAATNRPNTIDSALRRGDRFDYELTMGIPDKNARLKILKIITQSMRLEEDFNHNVIAEQTNGFVGADLKALAKTAGIIGIKRILNELDPFHDQCDDHQNEEQVQSEEECDNERDDFYHKIELNEVQLRGHYILESDFENALEIVEPSARREGFATIPDVEWDDIGALEDIRNELTIQITARIKYRAMFQKLNIDDPCGVLLFGPPGCGKTLLAKAIAAASGASFIAIKGPELLNKYVGESERAIRTVFERARTSPPCIVFFDELDALAPKREGGMNELGGSSNNVSSRVVNQLLTEMDGVKDRGQIFVIGATNRFDIIDSALIRPGRLGHKIYVGLPDENGRCEILKALTRKKPLNENVDLSEIAKDKRTERFSGADLASLVTAASMNVIKKKLNFDMKEEEELEDAEMNNDNFELCMDDFMCALKNIKPSISTMQAQEYQQMALLCET